MPPRFAPLLAAIAFAVLYPATTALTQSTRNANPHLIRVAAVTFERPDPRQPSTTFDPLVALLHQARAELEVLTSRRIEFEVVLGNYYQVWSWFRDRQIDAAFVSSFTGHLLEHDAGALPVLELVERHSENGYQALIAAAGPGENNPRGAFQRALSDLLAAAGHQPSKPPPPAPAHERRRRINFPAHLSSSGFVMPSLYAEHWLARQTPPPSDEVRRRFWRSFFESSRFLLHQGIAATEPNTDRTDIYFSYSGRSESSRNRDWRNGLSVWQPLAEDSTWHPPLIPHDLLVVRRTLAEDILGTADRDVLAERLLRAAAGVFTNDTFYSGVRRVNPGVQQAFRAAAERLFGEKPADPALATLDYHERWFELGKFDFTIDETLGFLRYDQRNSGVARLALVLSGGGVKSLYQARLLDRLYRGEASLGLARSIRNFDEEPEGPTGAPDAGDTGPMTVHTIVGTSGGAMLAFFAALVPRVSSLTQLAEKAAAQPLFPNFDIPRAISAIALSLILVALLQAAKAFGRRDDAPLGAQRRWAVPQATVTALFIPLLLIAAAILIRLLRVSSLEETARVARFAEGALYIVIAILAHAALVCIHWRRAERGGAMRRSQGALGMVFGFAIVGAAVLLLLTLSGNEVHAPVLIWMAPLATGGIAIVAASLLVAAAERWRGLTLENGTDYSAALFVVVTVVVLTYAVLLAADYVGRGTRLELTPLFWWWMLGAGSAISLLVLGFGRFRRNRDSLFGTGVANLVRDRTGGLTLTIGASMIVFFTIATVLWLLIVAPAIYGSEYAYAALEASLSRETLQSGSFRANLIVTGALLDDASCPASDEALRPGPLYSCFEGPTACARTTERWHAFTRPVPGDALQAVFASGSPFPVFPAHRVRLQNGCTADLVDGGYAHNVPLEAAALADSRQVLVLNATPDPADAALSDRAEVGPFGRARRFVGARLSGLRSKLVDGAPRVFEFMFSQAQELDRTVGRRLMVASLTPRPNDDWPSLLDFREVKRTLVTEQAQRDIAQRTRIGHIEVWGTPIPYAFVRSGVTAPPNSNQTVGVSRVPPPSPALGAMWLPSVRERLQAVVSRGGGAVVFDLDNTSLHGDIGDALFLKLVAELRYHGERDDFWQLIGDPSARSALRQYWQKFSGDAPKPLSAPTQLRYFDPDTWPGDFKDYVALFMRQYEALLAQPDGARQAYPWVVQLMVGLSPDEVSTIASELWRAEMDRGASAPAARDTKYGKLELPGGIRVHGEVADAIAALQNAKIAVWIVTASNQYVAEVAAARLGVDQQHVLGIRPRLDSDQRLTTELDQVTYREGKRAALARHKVAPLIAFGDSMTDLEMLRMAPVAVVIDRQRIPRSEMTAPPVWELQPKDVLTRRVVY